MPGTDESTLRAVIADHFRVPPEQITLETRFMDDLGADELDMVDLLMEIEDKLGLSAVIIDSEPEKEIPSLQDALAYVARLREIRDLKEKARALVKSSPAAALEACEAGLRLMPTSLTFAGIKSEALMGLGRFDLAAAACRYTLELLQTKRFDGAEAMPEDLRRRAIAGEQARLQDCERGGPAPVPAAPPKGCLSVFLAALAL